MTNCDNMQTMNMLADGNLANFPFASVGVSGWWYSQGTCNLVSGYNLSQPICVGWWKVLNRLADRQEESKLCKVVEKINSVQLCLEDL